MLFWTVVFIAYYLVFLAKGKMFYESTVKSGELALKQAEISDETLKKQMDSDILKAGLPVVLVGLPLTIIRMVYIFGAVDVDVLKYPTVGMIALIIIDLVRAFASKGKSELQTELGRIKYKAKLYSRRTVWGTLAALINLGYFGYMFYNLTLR